MVTRLIAVRVTAGEVVPFSVLIVGRLAGSHSRYPICGFGQRRVTTLYTWPA